MAKKQKKGARAGFLNPRITEYKGQDYVIAELRHDSKIGYSAMGFAGASEVRKQTDKLNSVLESFGVKKVASLFEMKENKIRKRVTAAPPSLDQPVSAEFAHSGFVQIFPRKVTDASTLAKRLNRQGSIWKAVVSPKPMPAGAPTGDSTVSRNFEPTQGYLHSPPNGIGAMGIWQKYEAKGKGVKICDIEGNWNFEHEDLPKFTQIGGDLIPDIGWKNHGTAVLGEMVSKRGRSGTVGICHQSKAVVQSAVIAGAWNTAGAIANATQKLKAGDVILIELQATGPNGKYVAMQYWDDVFSAIRAAIEKGICVVEAAGNGNENSDLSVFNNTGLQKDSGAIVVGAGIPPTNHFDFFGPDYGFDRYGDIGVPRSRIWFSNYGKILSLQAWGWHVTSTGYGDAQGGEENQWYTLRFSGTSSASPIVTGAVACIQGHAKAVIGKPLKPQDLRKLLIKTGTPQESGPYVPLSQHIGPQPNLIKALKSI